MFLLTLPDEPFKSPRGLAHAVTTGGVILTSMFATAICAVQGIDIPNELSMINIAGLSYLTGVNIGARR